MALMWMFGINGNPDNWPKKVVKARYDLVINGFRNPSMQEMMSLANRYSPKLNNTSNSDEVSQLMSDDITNFLNEVTMRTATSYISKSGQVRAALSVFPTPSMDFHFAGPWLQNICTKGIPPLDLELDHILDEFIITNPDPRLQIPTFPHELREMDNPAEAVCMLDWRIVIAKRIAQRRSLSPRDTKKLLNNVVKLGDLPDRSWSSKGHLFAWHGRRSPWETCNFSQFARLPQNTHFPVGLKGYVAGAMIPPSLDSNVDRTQIPMGSSALLALAQPIRLQLDEDWADGNPAAVFYHPSSCSPFTLVLNQNFRAVHQLEAKAEGSGDDVSVALVYSVKDMIGMPRGPKAPAVKLDWNDLWHQTSSLRRIISEGLWSGPQRGRWLKPLPTYLMEAELEFWLTKKGAVDSRGMERPFIYEKSWRVWSPKLARKLPLPHSINLALLYNKA